MSSLVPLFEIVNLVLSAEMLPGLSQAVGLLAIVKCLAELPLFDDVLGKNWICVVLLYESFV